jgi:uncharacterized membrane protein YtjA (UPF0391 family)
VVVAISVATPGDTVQETAKGAAKLIFRMKEIIFCVFLNFKLLSQ